MLFIIPSLIFIAIYILAAIIPAAILMRIIYKADSIEKEPPRLLWALILMGVLAGVISIVLEAIAESLLASLLSADSPFYTIATAFLVIAAVEEGTKFFFLKLKTWRTPEFNYRFDGVVYAVFVSLGFAAFENILYVVNYGLSVALPRALLSIPGHMGFAVFMGLFYARAKLCEYDGDETGKKGNLWIGYLAAVLLHGFYDACAMTGSALSTAVFVVFIIITDIAVIRTIKKEASTDEPVE